MDIIFFVSREIVGIKEESIYRDFAQMAERKTIYLN